MKKIRQSAASTNAAANGLNPNWKMSRPIPSRNLPKATKEPTPVRTVTLTNAQTRTSENLSYRMVATSPVKTGMAPESIHLFGPVYPFPTTFRLHGRSQKVSIEPVIDPKIKVLIALGASVAAGCQPCTEFQVNAARSRAPVTEHQFVVAALAVGRQPPAASIAGASAVGAAELVLPFGPISAIGRTDFGRVGHLRSIRPDPSHLAEAGH
jgi:alkylhydroperoxidase/carboxymuconolactone decarboxylase family protein YurZ